MENTEITKKEKIETFYRENKEDLPTVSELNTEIERMRIDFASEKASSNQKYNPDIAIMACKGDIGYFLCSKIVYENSDRIVFSQKYRELVDRRYTGTDNKDILLALYMKMIEIYSKW